MKIPTEGLLGALSLDVLATAFRRVRTSPGPGADGVSAERFAERLPQNLARLRQDVRSGRYHPGRLLHLQRLKPSGGVRQLGIPTVRDRVLQRALLDVMTPHLDPRLMPQVHGYRPGHNPTAAVKHLTRQVGRHRRLGLLKVDVEGLFDHLDHRLLREAVETASSDSTWRALHDRWLRAWSPSGVGVPQGAPLSPLLANLYLDHHVDRLVGGSGHNHPPVVGWIRYGDDTVLATSTPHRMWELLSWIDGIYRRAHLSLSSHKVHAQDDGQAAAFMEVLGITIRLGGGRLSAIESDGEAALIGVDLRPYPWLKT